MPVDLKLFDDLDAVAEDAGRELDREARPWLFDRIDWFRLVGRYTPPRGNPLVIRARDGSARAWLFLANDKGSALAFSNWYCLRTGPVLARTNGTAPPLGALADGLRQAGITRLYLSPIGREDPLAGALKRKGWAVAQSPINVSWRTCTKGLSFEDYWATRPSRLRNTARRKAKTPGLEIVIRTAFDAAAWRDYEAVYDSSWKPPEGSPALMRELAEREGAAGTLRLGLAYLDGRPVASQLWIVENDIATIHKLAYADDAKQHSPGTVLSVAMFRRAIEVDKVATIDFGIGNDAYKAEWMTEAEPLYALTAYDLLRPKGLLGAARAALSKLVPRARSQ
jgi:Acetyltransferase (GNAT) domain